MRKNFIHLKAYIMKKSIFIIAALMAPASNPNPISREER
jgi:hypothetical protein